jgi:uncharacterized protein YndB with AHSA1/START domain
MAKPFEVRYEVDVEGTPEQTWEALTTGSQIDGWWMGRTRIEPRLGGQSVTTLFGQPLAGTITAWEPPHRYTVESGEAPDGRHMILAYEIESASGGRALLRLVHSGFLPDADWELEFDALKNGDPMYVRKLAEYVKYFRGRPATPISTFLPQEDLDTAWGRVTAALGLEGSPRIGQSVRVRSEGLPPLDGEIDEVSQHFVGFRTADGMYRFFHGMGTVGIGHHLFAPVDEASVQAAWTAWLERTIA